MADTKRDFYEVLGVSRSAGIDQIKSAYRKLARKFHPDVNKNDRSAEAKFKEVQEAYDILNDPKKRQAYDQFGHAGVSSAAAAEAAAAAANSTRDGSAFRYSRRTPGGATVDFGDVDLNDLFESIGARQRKSRRNSVASPFAAEPSDMPETVGADIVHHVTLSFEHAARGTTMDLRFDAANRAFTETLSVKIPPGVDEGSKVRVRGKGQPSMMGAGRGDLVIITHIAAHAYFTRSGNDVLLDLPLSVSEAAIGTVVTVPTLDGPVELRVPPGVNSGKKLRIKGRGIPGRDGIKGDQLCRILILLPEALTDAEKAALMALDKAHHFDARSSVVWKSAGSATTGRRTN
ncbi:MAG: DnaJ C-terminal domain-containing protein [Phycisphaerae bacterium]